MRLNVSDEEVLEFFASRRVIYYSDVAKHFDIDLKLAVRICKNLMKKGLIRVRKATADE